jgi:uncharacterized protein
MSQDFPRPAQPRRVPGRPASRRSRVLLPTVVVLAALMIFFGVFTSFWTERLWYQSEGFSEVFGKTLVTRIGLFVLFGLVMALSVAVNAYIAWRLRPVHRPSSVEQQSLDRYREAIDPIRRWIVLGVALLLGLIAGGSAASHWKTFLQWRNSTEFGRDDPQFSMDVSFYVFDYPWWRFLVSFGFAAVVLGFLAGLVTHYVYGAIRLQTPGDKITRPAQAHLSVLIGLFVLLKAVAYWLDRYALVTDGNFAGTQDLTGAGYTDVTAQLPAKTILTFIALICAVLFFANVWRRSWLLPGISLGLLVLTAVLLGAIWPLIVQQFQVRPNEADRESEYIARNIAATRDAYDINDTQTNDYAATTSVTAGQLSQDSETIPGIRLLDPNVVSPTFQQQQQVRGFYTFSNPLDVDRYIVDGATRDMVVAVRDIDITGIPESQQNWINQHTVYTHGYGMVAAYGNQRAPDGSPVYAETDIPPVGVLGEYEPRIYFGENSPEYSIVGAPEGATPVELDIPEDQENQGQQRNSTYDGRGGVPIGNLFNKVLYAARHQEGNILLSNRLNEESKILYYREPRERLEKVAPWLHVDGNPYPAVVDGRILWILDGYTTLNSYPYSQDIPLDDFTSDSRTQRAGVAAQPSETVNYVRNSVKATVDAYDGTVTLYAWDDNDPVLRTWARTFDGTVKGRDRIPDALLDHLRYPEDLFKVQRGLLTRYHVTNPGVFYGGQDQWIVPNDPTVSGQVPQPPYYLSLRMPDQEAAAFSLTTTFVPRNRQNLAAFMAVDADSRSADYGTIRILRLPGNTQIDGPNQVANNFESDQQVATATLPLRQSGASTVEGNLLTLPVGGGLLYVQPVYVQRTGTDATYPLLRLVIVSFGSRIGVSDTLQGALDQIFQGDSGSETAEQQAAGQPPAAAPPPQAGAPPQAAAPPLTGDLAAAIAEAQRAYTAAEQAAREGRWADYGAALEQLRVALERAGTLQGTAISPPAPGG